MIQVFHAPCGAVPLIQVACRKGHAEIVLLLCAARADLEAQDDEGQTCLMAACNAGHTGIAPRHNVGQWGPPFRFFFFFTTQLEWRDTDHRTVGAFLPFAMRIFGQLSILIGGSVRDLGLIRSLFDVQYCKTISIWYFNFKQLLVVS